jgi:hypothetical protein
MTQVVDVRGDGTLVDLLDRLLAGGVVIAGDVVLSVADIDLVRVRLLALLSSVPTAAPTGRGDGSGGRS